jgi:hypothetical protein
MRTVLMLLENGSCTVCTSHLCRLPQLAVDRTEMKLAASTKTGLRLRLGSPSPSRGSAAASELAPDGALLPIGELRSAAAVSPRTPRQACFAQTLRGLAEHLLVLAAMMQMNDDCPETMVGYVSDDELPGLFEDLPIFTADLAIARS